MKRKVLSLITALALCLGLCPVGALAADREPGGKLCPHHPTHTDECGYVLPTPERDCTHNHDDGCYAAETSCIHQHTAECYSNPDDVPGVDEPDLCGHTCTEDSGCVTRALSCPHEHDDTCGYAPASPGEPCAFVCKICPVNDLVDKLPARLSADNSEQVQAQLDEIFELYDGLTVDEQAQVDLSPCVSLMDQIEELSAGVLEDDPAVVEFQKNETFDVPYEVSHVQSVDTKEFALLAPDSTAIQIKDGGKLYFKGRATSNRNIGIEVQSGGALIITDPDTVIFGSSYALDVAAGAEVKLSAGTYSSKYRAIQVADDNFAALLADGCAYFDESGNQLSPEDVKERDTVVVKQAPPEIKWDTTTRELEYDGSISTIKDKLLPHIIITASNSDALSQKLQYAYRSVGDTAFTDGLPLNVGVYEIKAYLPADQNYSEIATKDFLTLIIEAIDPLLTPPQAADLTYNGSSQALVTPGVLDSRAAGAVILYATSQNGEYSTTIPTGIDAKSYDVWYKVEGNGNYNSAGPLPVSNVKIKPKQINPKIEPAESSFVYDGSNKKPVITVKDGDTVLDENQYTVTWVNDADNINPPTPLDKITAEGTYTATIENVTGGNYTFTASAKLEIVPADQLALSITGQPAHVCYGDEITTLDTTGGTGNGEVEWSISRSDNNASGTFTINEKTGVFKVTDVGKFTVTAKRTVPNYGTVQDTWSFTVEPKQVTAEVTVTGKDYDGNTTILDASIKAVVKASDLVGGDQVIITGLKGSYADANAGTGKTVTLDSTSANADHQDKYTVSYPDTATADINPRNVTVAVTLSDHDLKTDNSATPPQYYVFDGSEKKPAVTVKATDNNALLVASDYDVDYANNKNVGNATVTVTAKAGGNYTFNPATVHFTIKEADSQLTGSPQARNLTYIGPGVKQELVTVGTATGGHIEYSLDGIDWSTGIPKAENAGTYTVAYKVVGDGNHAESGNGSISVTIKPKEITPKITLNQDTYTYSGNECQPTVDKIEDIIDGNPVTVAATEYDVTYRDNVNAGTATVVVSDVTGGNYIINGTKTFTIQKAGSTFTKEPKAQTGLQYSGAAQELVTVGGSAHGTVVYSLDGGNYSPVIPSATAVGTYAVSYKIQGDANHEDTVPVDLPVTIAKNTVMNPTISLSSDTFKYNGSQQKPTITVYDDKSVLIPGHEYTVVITDAAGNPGNAVDKGVYTVTITTPSTSNYDIPTTANNTRTFEIVEANQETMSITGTQVKVSYGDVIQLGTTSGVGGSTVTWKVEGSPAGTTIGTTITQTGLLTVKDINQTITVTATRNAGGNYDAVSATWEFTAGKKAVTAALTGADREYDKDDNTATVKAEVPTSELAFVGDSITINDLPGTFADPNVGTDKKVTVDSSNPTVTGTNCDKYDITYPATTTASITKANATVTAAPSPVPNLEYTGKPQELVTAGSATGGTMEYSLDNRTYSASLPAGTDAGNYDIWYRVKGDGNHNDTMAVQLTSPVTIQPQEVTDPIIELTPNSVSYDGGVHQPSVTVKDKYGRIIPDSEYSVAYQNGGNWKDVGTYGVTVTDKNGGNYTITEKTENFEILIMGQSPLSIVNKPGQVHYGDTFTLSTSGGSGAGTVNWQSDKPDIATIDQNGLVTTKKAGGPVKITATKDTDSNYGATSVTWTFSVEKKPVTAIVTAKDREYVSNSTTADLVISWQPGDLPDSDRTTLTSQLETSLTGTFDNANVGNNKTVTITGTVPASDKYDISYNNTTTASITPATASVTAPTAQDLTYSGKEQALVSSGSATGGDIVYSLDGAIFDTAIPKKKNAGEYTVWYKARGDGNHKDSAVSSVPVTIQPKTVDTTLVIELSPDEFGYDGNPKKPDVVVKDNADVIPASEYTVSYQNNVAAAAANAANAPTVTVTSIPDGNYSINGSAHFTITASAATLITPPEGLTLTYTGNSQPLVRGGTALNGQVVYSSTQNGTYSTSIPTEINAGTYTVYYKVQGNPGYSGTDSDFVTATIQPKPVTPVITLTLNGGDPMPYTGNSVEPGVTVVVDGNTLTKGTDYTVEYINNKNVGTATVIVQSASGKNYQFYATKTFEIAKAQAVFAVSPVGNTLTYNGAEQELIEEYTGTSLQGIVLYSLNAVTYSAEVPTGTKAREYTIYAKIQGDSTHADSDPIIISAKIEQNDGSNLTVALSSNSLNYTGSELKPTVTVTDDSGNVIPASDYTVSYSDNVNAGTATVTVTGKAPNCTAFTKTTNFAIVGADQPVLTITGKPEGTIYYGDTFQLKTTGGVSGGTVTWTSSDETVATIANGVVTVHKAGSTVIEASMASSGNYGGTVEDSWTLFAQPRPLTVTVLANNKPYDPNDNTATFNVVINNGLVPGETDTVTVAATGQFMDGNAGDNKTVIIQSLTVTPADKYTVVNPGTTTANITPVTASVNTPPTALTLTYNGREQALINDTGCTVTGGNLAYSLDGVNYTFIAPKGKDVGDYDVWYKVIASDRNYMDSAPVKVSGVKIQVNTVTNPQVICTPDEFRYDGTEKIPTVTVKDGNGQIIPNTEYTVSVDKTAIAADTYTVTVTPGSNYQFNGSTTGTFKIVSASQSPLTIVSTIPSDICYGDSFYLSVTGGSGNGAIQWSIKDANGVAKVNSYGEMAKVTVEGVGTFTVEAYREAKDGYSQSNTISIPLEAKPKPITPVVKANDKSYDGSKNATLSASVKAGDLVNSDTITLTVNGQFDTPDVGGQKQVKIVPGTATGTNAAKYNIIWPASVTASITRVNVELATIPAGQTLTYNGSAQELLSSGSTKNSIGTIEYSLDEKGGYSTAIPTGTAVGDYEVWYKVEDTVNYMGIPATKVKAEIKAAPVSPDPGSGDDPGSTDTDSTPAPSAPDGSSTSGTTSASMNTTTANTVVDAAEGSRLVNEAAKNQSETVVIKPEITGNVSKAEVSVPASMLSQMEQETDANLVVSTPIADVTIPNGALSTLSSAGGTVDIVTERTEHGVVLTLSADGKPVDSVPGGVTLTVPAAEAGPGAVAVLVYPDGTRETIRKSVAVDGVMSIPMSGSGTVEIVDNSKAFTDVTAASWEADAVAFASAHEMFSGTSETTFSPEQPMSRGMLATVLYNLEGKPDQDQPCTFSDISGDDWYADSVAWATENGIASGYGDGQFGPDDSITREQFAVMLWKYAGSPEAEGEALAFTDADQVSGYALEALRWATENGILNGYSSGQLDPGGIATRAQAAQMLKSFMENT